MQNFHFQSGGWMTEESARLYDMQVEVLFSGAANAMRRQALVPMAEALKGRDQRRLAYADIACGTGRVPAPGARRPFRASRRFADRPLGGLCRGDDAAAGFGGRVIQPVVAKAEALPLPRREPRPRDLRSFSSTSCRRRCAAPWRARSAASMKPGGLFVFVESLQPGDAPDYDGLLEVFPALFHEPYFKSYLDEDLEALFGEAGFAVESTTNAFFAKVVAFRKR